MDRAPDFGSDGCQFESGRGRLYLGVHPSNDPRCSGFWGRSFLTGLYGVPYPRKEFVMKRCRDCGLYKSEEEFNWRYQGRDIKQPICKECSKVIRKKHYDAHREEEVARSYKVTRHRRDAALRFVYEYLSESKCADCGEYDFTVLTFDHVRGEKKMEVSQMAQQGYSIEDIQEEIGKCQVVCFNCHMRRESRRRSGGRFRKFWPKFPGEKD